MSLTWSTERWDPVSKQPRFKAGAVRVEKLPTDKQGVILAKEGQSAAKQRVREQKLEAADVKDYAKRERHVALWLGSTYEAIDLLENIYDDLIPRLVHDLEVVTGLQTLCRIAKDTTRTLEPFAKKYEASTEYGRTVSKGVRDALFPKQERTDSYEALITLQGLHVYLSNIEGHLTALRPASQALWDGDFYDAVQSAANNVRRSQQWVKHQITVRSPQTLVVPSKVLWSEMTNEDCAE